MTLAVAQFLPRPGRLAEAIARHREMAEAAADRGAELVLFPELSLTGYSLELTHDDALHAGHPALEPLAQVSRTRSIAIIAGAPLAAPEGLLIACLSFLPDGRRIAYSKKYLHPGEEVCFAAGEGGALLALNGRSVGLAICAEINHPIHAETTVAAGAEIYAASCFLTPAGFKKDCQRLQGYATKHGVMVLLSNFAGPCGGLESAGGSAIWDERGQLLAAAPGSGEYLVLATWDEGRWAGSIQEAASSDRGGNVTATAL